MELVIGQTREKTSQTSPKKPVRSLVRRLSGQAGSEPDLGPRLKAGARRALTSSQSLRVATSVPSLGLAKSSGDTDPKVTTAISFIRATK